MKKFLSLVLILISANSMATDKIGDQIQFANEHDKTMNDAIAKAQGTLGEFFKIVDNPPKGAEGFKLKVMMSDDSGVEHLWFSPFKKIEGGYAGILVNDPGVIKSLEYGKPYAFRESQITDWGYTLNGKQIGSFTVCALFESMDKKTVSQYKRDHGFVCDSK